MFTFLQKNAEFELNLPFTCRNKFDAEFTDCTEDNTPITLFDDISELIFRELKQDNFKRFQQSEIWIRFIYKNQHLLKDILADDDIINPSDAEAISTTSSSTDSGKNDKLGISFGFASTHKATILDEGIFEKLDFLTLKDFNVYLRLLKDDYWKVLDRKTGFNISISKEKLACDGKSCFMIREVGFLPFNTSKISLSYRINSLR